MVSQVFYYNQSQQYPQVQKDYEDVRRHVKKADSAEKEVLKAVETLTPLRRVSSLGEKMDGGDYFPAAGLASLALINLPEDCRDVKSACRQLFDKNYKPSYNHHQYQHKFSFFRGTMLENMANPNKSKKPKLADALFRADKNLVNTGFGKKILNALNVETVDVLDTGRKDILYSKDNPVYVEALKFEGKGPLKAFGELTARAMTRTTILGMAVLGAFELPKIFISMGKGDGISEQAGNTLKQTAKSGVNVASITAGIAYGGALGAKHMGALGSIVGMGVGAVFGTFTSKKIQDIVG